jgi:hypothetical protein
VISPFAKEVELFMILRFCGSNKHSSDDMAETGTTDSPGSETRVSPSISSFAWALRMKQTHIWNSSANAFESQEVQMVLCLSCSPFAEVQKFLKWS